MEVVCVLQPASSLRQVSNYFLAILSMGPMLAFGLKSLGRNSGENQNAHHQSGK